MDALVAAPASHRVLLENDRVRVLEVVIEPRTREPEHTHQAASVMIVDEPARIRYYRGGTLQYESQARFESPPGGRVRWMEPEGPHSVQTSTSAATTQSASSSSNVGAARIDADRRFLPTKDPLSSCDAGWPVCQTAASASYTSAPQG